MREDGDTGRLYRRAGRRNIALQQEVIKQDFFTWENMKYLEKPNLAPEEARDYAALGAGRTALTPANSARPSTPDTPRRSTRPCGLELRGGLMPRLPAGAAPCMWGKAHQSS